MHRLMLSLGTAALILALGNGDAQARLFCDGNFQAVNGLPVATPYCRELNLALRCAQLRHTRAGRCDPLQRERQVRCVSCHWQRQPRAGDLRSLPE